MIDLPLEAPGKVLVAWNQHDARYFDAYRIDIATGQAELVGKNPGDIDSWYSDTHGRIRAAVALLKNTKTEIRVRKDEGTPFTCSPLMPMTKTRTSTASDADGTFLYLTSARDSNTSRLVKLDAAAGKETVVEQDPDYDVDGPIISEHTHVLEAVAYNKDRLTYKVYDPQFQKDLDALGKVHDGDILFDSSTTDEKKWIITYNSPTDPGATYVYDRDTGKVDVSLPGAPLA